MRIACCVGLAILCSAFAQPVGAAPDYRPGEVLVRFRAGTTAAAETRSHDKAKGRVKRRFARVPRLQLVEVPDGTPVDKALEAYRSDPAVQYAEPNYLRQANLLPNDPQFPQLYGLHNLGGSGFTLDADIDAPEAWDVTTGSSDVVVAVIDTGIDFFHPDLVPNLFRNEADCDNDLNDDDGNGYVDDCFGIDTLNGDSNPFDDHSHGTHVAGTIGARGNNGTGVTGVNWSVKIMTCKFLGADGRGSDADAVTCFEYVAAMRARGVNVIATNNSWGGAGASRALDDAVRSQMEAGILMIAAAGNDGINHDASGAIYPADIPLPNVVAVAATGPNDLPASFTDHGGRTIHLAAPGVNVLSTNTGGGYVQKSGTSMATPHVTGVAALLAADDPSRDWRAIRNLILTGGDLIAPSFPTITRRRLNAYGSLTCTDNVVRTRLRPELDSLRSAPGLPVTWSVLHVKCAAANGAVAGVVQPGNVVVNSHDDGVDPDEFAGDGVYTGEWTAGTPGTYTIDPGDGSPITVIVVSTDGAILNPDMELGRFGSPIVPIENDLLIGAADGGVVYRIDPDTNSVKTAYTDPTFAPGPYGLNVVVAGSDVVVAAPYDVTDGVAAGAAHLFDGDTGERRLTFYNPTPRAEGLRYDLFGGAVAAVGTNVLVTAQGDDAMGEASGSAYLYDGSTGQLLHTFNAPIDDSRGFGGSAASDGKNVFISGGTRSWVAGVFEFDADPASPTFGELRRHFPFPVGVFEAAFKFGRSVSVSGGRLYVNAPDTFVEECAPGLACLPSRGVRGNGRIFVYDLQTGERIQQIDEPSTSTRGIFGWSWHVFGDMIAIGAPSFYATSGPIWIYHVPSGALLQQVHLGSPGLSGFGQSITVRGDEAFVGAPFDLSSRLGTVGIVYRRPVDVTAPSTSDQKCYRASGTPPSAVSWATVQVTDAVETRLHPLRLAEQACYPVGIDGSTPQDLVPRLQCYAAKSLPGTPRFVRSTITAVDRFGTHELGLSRPMSVCLNATEGDPLRPYVEAPTIRSHLDHLKCYKARGAGLTSEVTLSDPLETKVTRRFKPIAYCAPAAIDGGTIHDPAAHLVCYKIRDASGQPGFVKQGRRYGSALRTETFMLKKAQMLCVRATLSTP